MTPSSLTPGARVSNRGRVGVVVRLAGRYSVVVRCGDDGIPLGWREERATAVWRIASLVPAPVLTEGVR